MPVKLSLRESLFDPPSSGLRAQLRNELFFKGLNAYVDLFAGGRLHGAVQVGRASGGTTEISPGVFTQAAVNEPRYMWAGGRRGVLVDLATTNLVPASAADLLIAGVNWNTGTYPVQSTAGGGYKGMPTRQLKFTASGMCFLSKNIPTKIGWQYTATWAIRRVGAAGASLGSGLLNTDGYESYAEAAALVSKITTDWQILSCTFTARTANTVIFAAPYDAGGTTYEVAYLQLEAGPTASSYVPTVGSPAFRAADLLSITPSDFGFNPVEGTFVAEYMPLSNNLGYILSAPQSGSELITYRPGGRHGTWSGYGANEVNTSNTAPSGIRRVATAYNAYGISVAMNGAGFVNGAYPYLNMANYSSLKIGPCLLFGLRYYPIGIMSAGELQAVAT